MVILSDLEQKFDALVCSFKYKQVHSLRNYSHSLLYIRPTIKCTMDEVVYDTNYSVINYNA